MASSWTDKDKAILLSTLKTHGSSELTKIKENLPHKTIIDIRTMIARYERFANYDPNDKCDFESSIDKWIEVMRKHTDYNELSGLAKTLKYISKYETKDDSLIDLSGTYEFLESIAKGLAPRELDEVTMGFLMHVFHKIAKEAKSAVDDEVKSYLDKLTVETRSVNSYGKRKKLGHCSLNPLNFSKQLTGKLKETQSKSSKRKRTEET